MFGYTGMLTEIHRNDMPLKTPKYIYKWCPVSFNATCISIFAIFLNNHSSMKHKSMTDIKVQKVC